MEVINIYKPIYLEVMKGDFVYIYYSFEGKIERLQGRVRFMGLTQLHPLEIEYGDGRVGILSIRKIVGWGFLNI